MELRKPHTHQGQPRSLTDTRRFQQCQCARSAFILNCNRGSWAHSTWPHKDVLADVHSSTVPDSPNAQITQMFTLVKGHTSGAMTNRAMDGRAPNPLWERRPTQETFTPSCHLHETSGRRTRETEQIGGLRGCSGNSVNHKRA